MLSLPLLVLDSPNIKFMEISIQDVIDTDNDVYSQWGKTLDFTCLHAMHGLHIRSTSIFMLDQ